MALKRSGSAGRAKPAAEQLDLTLPKHAEEQTPPADTTEFATLGLPEAEGAALSAPAARAHVGNKALQFALLGDEALDPNAVGWPVLSLKAQRTQELHLVRAQRAAETVQELQDASAREAGAIRFVPRWMVYATMPYKEPKPDVEVWARRSGNFTFSMQPGIFVRKQLTTDEKGRAVERDLPVSYGFPYGTYPRLLLAWITSEVVRTGEREMNFDGFVRFLEEIGRCNLTSGPRGGLAILREQAQRLFTVNISVSNDPDAAVWQHGGFRLVDTATIASFTSPGSNRAFLKANFRLSELFHASLLEISVPFDLRILKELSDSPQAMDIYLWLTHRVVSMNRPLVLSWQTLQEQFGSQAGMLQTFKASFKQNMVRVAAVYTDIQGRYLLDRDGLRLQRGAQPSVSMRR